MKRFRTDKEGHAVTQHMIEEWKERSKESCSQCYALCSYMKTLTRTPKPPSSPRKAMKHAFGKGKAKGKGKSKATANSPKADARKG